MADEQEDTAVEVDASETVVESPDAVVEASPTIVVESGEGDADVDAKIDRAVEMERRVAAIETNVALVVEQLAELGARTAEQEMRQDIVEEVVAQEAEQQDAVEDAVAEDIEEELGPEADEEPESAKRHFFFRSLKEWRGEK